ncbi:MAG TPA: DUF5916 domain-containing protein [Steroidobacteraceae bacterium]|nr:DUF5916 domain-containing protein [Steroidobacteraceae bacterium]
MLAASCPASAAENAAPERAAFGRAAGEIVIDGRLDDASWKSATPQTKFYEIYPANIGEPPVATMVSFLYDDRNIYVAVRALDPRPAAIRAPIVRRDQVLSDQDYIEVFLDPLNTRRSAFFFRVSARGIVTDGQYDDKNRLRDYSPDFDFEAATVIDEEGWTAEMRIPLSSLRYQAGVENSWAYVIYRNLPREQVVTIASAPIPRGANCDLCYANVIEGIPVSRSGSLSVIPHVEYARLDDGMSGSNQLDGGIDLTWKPRENTVVDATIFPDFSQIEADAPQLTANTQFALALTEKRPFFLEGTDLLTTQIPVVYTRAFTDPDVGVRITDRSARHEYTAMALRDAGGGTVIEPGPINSRAALQDFESTAFVGRDRFLLDNGSVGMLATGRFNDDGSQNVVVGVDGTWTPSAADQVSAQWLRSETKNPQRPDLLESWTGQGLNGEAGALGWAHSSDAWYANVMYQSYSRDFRAWDGFVTQVGVSSLVAITDAYFYPDDGGFINRFGPELTVMRVQDNSGGRISQSVAPGVVIRAARDTYVSLAWQPNALSTTLAGPRYCDSWVLGFSSTPFAWMPQAMISLSAGETPDNATGAIGDGINLIATIPLRFSRLEVGSTISYQSLRSRALDNDEKTLFTERNMQVTATWHFSNKLNLRVTHQQASFDAAPPFGGLQSDVHARSRLSSVLLSYQSNWQTRYYVGVLTGSDESSGPIHPDSRHNQIFAKISYAFSN